MSTIMFRVSEKVSVASKKSCKKYRKNRHLFLAFPILRWETSEFYGTFFFCRSKYVLGRIMQLKGPPRANSF